MKKTNQQWTMHVWNNTYNSYRKFACQSFFDEYGIYHFVPYEKCEWVNVVSPFISPMHVASYPISNIYILLKSDDQTNTAEFDVPATTNINPGDIISIRCNDEVVHGYKTGVIREIQEKTDKTKHVVTIDPSVLLKNLYCRHEQVGIFNSKISIRNPDTSGTYLTLNAIAQDKLTQKYLGDWASSLPYVPPQLHDNTEVYLSGAKVFEGYGKSDRHPLRNNEYLPTLMISELSLYESYYKLFNSICGFKVWYNAVEEGSLLCHIDYGFIRSKYHSEEEFPTLRLDEGQYSENYGLDYHTSGILLDIAREYIVDTKRIDNNKVREPVDEVSVYSNNNNLKGYYINTDVSFPSTSVVYQVQGNYGIDELNWLAERIYNDRRLSDATYKVIFPPGCIRFKDGEYFGGDSDQPAKYGIGDSTIQPIMPFRYGQDYDPRSDPSDSVWQINEIIMTPEKTEVTVGSSYITIFEMFKDKLTEVKKGTDVTTETRTYRTGALTLDAGFHPNILYENFILPGNATGDVSIHTMITSPVKESGRTIPHEKRTVQYYFEMPELLLPALSEPYVIESGMSFATVADTLEILEQQMRNKSLYTVPYIEDVPAKYDIGEVTIQYQVGCGDEDNNYTWCATWATSLMLPMYLLYTGLIDSKTHTSNIECANAAVRCSQSTAALAYYSNHVSLIIDDIRTKIHDGAVDYSKLYNNLYDITALIEALQHDHPEYYGEIDFATSYFGGCSDDIQTTIDNCNMLLNGDPGHDIYGLLHIQNEVDDIIQDIDDDVIDWFCSDKCEEIQILEVNDQFPTLLPSPLTYEHMLEDENRNACDICVIIDTLYDQITHYYDGVLTPFINQLNLYIAEMEFIRDDCKQCLEGDKQGAISTCEGNVSNCDAAYGVTVSNINGMYPTDCLEKTKALRLANREKYHCINDATHHYMDCSKLGDRIEDIDCDMRCEEGVCFNYVEPDFKELVSESQKLKNDMFIEFPTFTYSIYTRYLRYHDSYTFINEFIEGNTSQKPLESYLSDYFNQQLPTLCSDGCNGSKNEVLNRFTVKIHEFETWYNGVREDLQYSCMDESSAFDVKFDVDFELHESEFPSYSTFDAESLEIVESDNSKVHILNAEPYTTLNQYFKIKAWPGVIPINNRGNLPRSTIRIKVKNNSYKFPVYIENMHTKVVFYYYSDTPFTMHDRPYSELMVHAQPSVFPSSVLDAVPNRTGVDVINDQIWLYPFFVYLADYTEPVHQVVAHVMRYNSNTSQYYQDSVFMYPTTILGNIQIYASHDYDGFSSDDKLYYTTNGTDSNYYVQVVTPTTISSEDAYKSLWVESLQEVNNPDCIFRIHIVPKHIACTGTGFATTDMSVFPSYANLNTYVISIPELWDSLNLIQFYNVITGDFSSTSTEIYADIPRYTIDPVYYETLPNTYKNNAFFIPKMYGTHNFISETPIMSINKFIPERFPSTSVREFAIFNGGNLKFSDNLMNAPEDGVKSRDVFIFGSENINTISITSAERYTYELDISYDVYKGVHCDGEYENIIW